MTALVWFLHSIAMSSNACVTALYWPFVMPDKGYDAATSVINVYLHSINYVLLLIDLAIVAFQIRILHAVYGSLLCISYGTFTYILWQAGGTNAVYPFLDWKQNPFKAAGFIVVIAVVVSPIVQVLTFCLYLFRKWCFCKCCHVVEKRDVHPETYNLKDDSDCETSKLKLNQDL